jgi:hypothetical protein
VYLISTLNWFTFTMFSYFLILTGYQEVTKETCSSWKWSIHLTGFLHDMLSLYTIYRYIAPYCHHVFFLSRDSNYGQSFLKLELILASQCVTTIQGKLTWSILEVCYVWQCAMQEFRLEDQVMQFLTSFEHILANYQCVTLSMLTWSILGL